MANISKGQIEQTIAALCIAEHADEGECDAAKLMLQGLLDQPEQEPVGYVNGDELDNLASDGLIVIASEPTNWRKTKLYTYPAPFTPINADMVTDEMHEEFNKTHMPFGPDREIMAAACNAVGKYMGAKK